MGIVKDAGGIAQLGATVLLLNRFEKVVDRALTNERGQFGFDSLLPDTYAIRVSLPSFVPAIRSGILVQPGMRSFLAINLASVLSSVEFVYSSPNPPQMLADDWRWVLRSSMSTRPILRLLPETRRPNEPLFTNTRGLVRFSAGDGANAIQGNQPDLGTAFALATSLYGDNQLQVSGNVGYISKSGLPTASFRTRFSREGTENGIFGGNAPDVQLTVRQTMLPGRGMAQAGVGSAPAFSTISGLVMDRARIGDNLSIVYGAQLESVTFVERLNLLSPFARFEYRLGANQSVQAAWSSGTAPEDLYLSMAGSSADPELSQGISTLSAFPRVSMRDRHTHVQRTEQAELAYNRNLNSKTEFGVAAYYERVANAALMAGGDTNAYSTGEMLPDLFTRSSVFNIGSYQRRGLMATVSRQLSQHWTAQASFGNSGTLQPRNELVTAGDAGQLRSALRNTQRNWMGVRLTGVVPGSGTRFAANYLFTDYRTALPAHRYLTQRISPDLGLNVQIRQPLPSLGIWAGRMEALLELRNVLDQGNLNMETTDGRRILLVPSPSTVRGGLAFIF